MALFTGRDKYDHLVDDHLIETASIEWVRI